MIQASHTVRRDGILADLLPDLTPLIDVMFMLIIFLLLTASATLFEFDITLPEDAHAMTAPVEDHDQVRISISADGWKLDDRPFASFDAIADQVRRIEDISTRGVLVFCDKQVAVERLLSLLTFLREQNIPAADIVMERSQ